MRPAVLFFLSAVLLTACARDEAPRSATTDSVSGAQLLPAPADTTGGVTGMPARPGPGPVGPPSPPGVSLDDDGNPVLPGTEPAEGTGGAFAAEPAADDAVAMLRDYHAALNSGDFARAQALWVEGSQAIRQSPQQFAAAFAGTTGVSVQMMPPGRIEAAADSHSIEIPVAITATQEDGSQQRYVGAYVLRSVVGDGAGAGQRTWRIASADLRPAEGGDAQP